MYYRHNLDCYQYPERCDEHMITVKELREINIDEQYPYVPKTFWSKCKRAFYWVATHGFVFHLLPITHGLRIYGRKEFKKHRKGVLKDGFITVSNHVFMWDYLCVQKAVRPGIGYFPAWQENLRGPNGPLIRLAGGIPIPIGNTRAMIKFKEAMEEVLTGKKWMHFFPEGSMWYFYPDIRPLKKAVFKYAVQYNRPIVPITMSFRPRRGLMKLFGKTPRVDLHIGEPMLPDQSLSVFEATRKMHADAYRIMQEMNGIHPGDPTYNEDQNPLHYKKTM